MHNLKQKIQKLDRTLATLFNVFQWTNIVFIFGEVVRFRFHRWHLSLLGSLEFHLVILLRLPSNVPNFLNQKFKKDEKKIHGKYLGDVVECSASMIVDAEHLEKQMRLAAAIQFKTSSSSSSSSGGGSSWPTTPPHSTSWGAPQSRVLSSKPETFCVLNSVLCGIMLVVCNSYGG